MCKGEGTSQNRKPTVVPVTAYTVVDTLNKVEAEALVYTQAYKFPEVEAKSITVTLVGYQLHSKCETVQTHWPL